MRRVLFAVVSLGLVAALLGPLAPVGAHVNDSAWHLWRSHIRPRADNRYAKVTNTFTRTQSDRRYYRKAQTYSQSQADGLFYRKAQTYSQSEADALFYSRALADTNFGRPSASAISDTNTLISSGSVNVLSATITLPKESVLVAIANVEVDADGGNNDDAFCFINTGAAGNPSDDISERVTIDIPETASARGSMTNVGVATLPAGTHTIRSRCGVNVVGQTINFDSGTLVVFTLDAP